MNLMLANGNMPRLWHDVQHEFQKQRPQIDPDETLVQFGKRFVQTH